MPTGAGQTSPMWWEMPISTVLLPASSNLLPVTGRLPPPTSPLFPSDGTEGAAEASTAGRVGIEAVKLAAQIAALAAESAPETRKKFEELSAEAEKLSSRAKALVAEKGPGIREAADQFSTEAKALAARVSILAAESAPEIRKKAEELNAEAMKLASRAATSAAQKIPEIGKKAEEAIIEAREFVSRTLAFAAERAPGLKKTAGGMAINLWKIGTKVLNEGIGPMRDARAFMVEHRKWLIVSLVVAAAIAAGSWISIKHPDSVASLLLKLRPAADAVADLTAVPMGDSRAMARYHVFKQGSPSKAYLEGWAAANDCRAYQRDRTNEFAMADRIKEAQQNLAGGKAEKRIRIPVNVTLGEYEFEKGGFALTPLSKGKKIAAYSNNKCPPAPMDVPGALPGSFRLVLDDDMPWKPLLPMAQEPARAFVQEFRDNRSRRIYAEVVVDLGEVEANKIAARPVAMYFWKDNGRNAFLGAVGRAKPGSEAPNVQPPAASPAPQSPPPKIAEPAIVQVAPQSPAATSSPAPALQEQQPAVVVPPPAPPPTAPQTPAPVVKPPLSPVSGKATVVNTGTLRIDGNRVVLAGIEGVTGEPAKELQTFIASQGGQVNCTPLGEGYMCATESGVNVAEAALLNGAARAAANASARFKELEQAARSKRVGIWAR